MAAKDQIKRDIELKELLKMPRAKELFLKYRFACLKCGGMGKEKLHHAARCHGIDADELIRQILDGKPTRE